VNRLVSVRDPAARASEMVVECVPKDVRLTLTASVTEGGRSE
jgi:hypothetical protein